MCVAPDHEQHHATGLSALSLRSNKDTLRGQLSLSHSIRSSEEVRTYCMICQYRGGWMNDVAVRAGFQVKESVPLEEIFQEPGEGGPEPIEFVKSHGLSTEEATELLRRVGRNEIEEKVTPKWLIFMQQLWQPMPLMIW